MDEERSVSFLDLAVANTRSAYANTLGSAINDGADGLQIQIPAAFGHIVSVADSISEFRTAPADFTYFRHNRRSLRVEVPVYQFASVLATHRTLSDILAKYPLEGLPH